MNDILTVD
jgi:hypothetical protein